MKVSAKDVKFNPDLDMGMCEEVFVDILKEALANYRKAISEENE